tara:strand:+ start:156 stop:446 length:291 start_codon:yes stop_codon:yes gene_type:complete
MDSINEFLNPSELKLVTFREIARKVPKPFRWAIVWILLEIEPKYIAYKAKKAIDLAVKQYHWSMPTVKIKAKYKEEPSKVLGLDQISITTEYENLP